MNYLNHTNLVPDNNNVIRQHEVPVRNKNNSIDTAELKIVLERYIKSKLPTHLNQKNPCLYTTSSVHDNDEIHSRSFNILYNQLDRIDNDDKLNSSVILN